MDHLEFAQPGWLAAGVLAGGGLIIAYRLFDRRRRADLAKFVSGNLLEQFLASVSRPRRLLKRACFVAAVALVFGALARPQLGYEWREVKRRGIDILFALDASRSMLAEDISPNRLERAKLGMVDFVDKLEGDRIGLMPFAGSAFMLCPLTLDYNAFRESLDAIDTDIIPRRGTDLASAIREASRTLEEAGNNHRILVIITDGEDLQGEALDAAEQAAQDGMVIHTVGIGSAAGELIPIGGDFVRDQQGELVRSRLDEDSLRAIAEAAGGIYAPFGQSAEGLQQIYAEKLSLVPKDELAQRMQKVPIERFHWPLAAAVALFFIEFLIGDRRTRRDRGSRARLATPALIALILLPTLGTARAADARSDYNAGVSSYQSGDYESAGQEFQASIENTDDLSLQNRAYYNLGNSLFKAGAARLGENADPNAVIAEWERSLDAFDGALALRPEDEDAKFNRELVQRKIDELKQQQQEQQEQEQQQQDQQGSDDQQQDQQGSDEPQQDQKGSDEPQQDQKGTEGQEQQDQSDGQEGEQAEPQEGEGQEGEGGEPEGGRGSEGQEEQSAGADEAEDQSAGQGEATPGEEQEDLAGAGEAEQGQPSDPAPSDGQRPGGLDESSSEADGGAEETAASAEPGDAAPSADQRAGAPEGERRRPGEMSKEEARQLLRALEDDEERVLLVPATRGAPRNPSNTIKGKDW